MNHYTGVIIEESLGDKSVLNQIAITSTKVEAVTPRHNTPWLEKWTMHAVAIAENDAAMIADKLSKALNNNPSAWYADFKNESTHYIIFPHRVFAINRRSPTNYDEAIAYGISIGIPAHQVDFT